MFRDSSGCVTAGVRDKAARFETDGCARPTPFSPLIAARESRPTNRAVPAAPVGAAADERSRRGRLRGEHPRLGKKKNGPQHLPFVDTRLVFTNNEVVRAGIRRVIRGVGIQAATLFCGRLRFGGQEQKICERKHCREATLPTVRGKAALVHNLFYAPTNG